MPARNAYPSGHLVPSPILGLANAPIVETEFLELAMSLLDFSPRIPLGTFSILLHVCVTTKKVWLPGVACRQGMLTPQDTWSWPTLGLASVLMLRPIPPELVLFPDFEFRTSLGTSVLLRSLDIHVPCVQYLGSAFIEGKGIRRRESCVSSYCDA